MNKDNCLNHSVNKLNIQQLTRLNEDKCSLKVRNKTSEKPGEYFLSNHYQCDCKDTVMKNSLEYPTLLSKDGYGYSACNIDIDSSLRNAKNLTNLKTINQLNQRPYLTVPFMGRGTGNIKQETMLNPGENTYQSKPCNNLSGVYIDRFIPLVGCLENNVQNVNHIIPENSDKTWKRGGQDSRQIIRNEEYLNKCGYKFNGKFWN